MKLRVLDLFSESNKKVRSYYAVVESDYGNKVVPIPKNRYLRAEVGRKVTVTFNELKHAKNVGD